MGKKKEGKFTVVVIFTFSSSLSLSLSLSLSFLVKGTFHGACISIAVQCRRLYQGGGGGGAGGGGGGRGGGGRKEINLVTAYSEQNTVNFR